MMITLVLLGTLSAPGQDDGAAPSVSQTVLEFARSNLGRKVGNGECATLAIEGLKKAGTQPHFKDGGVVWGAERGSIEEAQPGDIIQFANVTFIVRKKLPRGGMSTFTYSFPRHTAILAAIKKAKGDGPPVLTILHQNAGLVDQPEEERRKVSEWTIDLKDLQNGDLTAFEPGKR